MLKEIEGNTDVWEIIEASFELMEHVVNKYNIKTFDEFQCPLMKALAKTLYVEVE